MNTIVNTHQAEAWNGYEGAHWADHQDRYDAVNSGFNDLLLGAANIAPADRVLDIGCGNGQTTRLAARRAVQGHAVGIDLSGPMLERARATALREGIANVTFERADAQVHAFPHNGFDVAVSRFGIMFFADPVAAFANIGHGLRPGGRVAFLCLRNLGTSDLGPVLTAMGEHLPARPMGEDSAGPFSLADPARTSEILTAACFENVHSEPVEAPQVWGRDTEDAADFLAAWGPVRFLLNQVDDEAAERARDALKNALRPHAQADAVRLRGTAWLVTAERS